MAQRARKIQDREDRAEREEARKRELGEAPLPAPPNMPLPLLLNF